MQNVIDRVKELAEPIVAKQNLEIVDVELGSNNKGQIIKIFVGSRKGPSVTNIIAITKEFNKAWEAKGNGYLSFDYQLEVSSPGLDRPLKTVKDFERNIGRTVKVTYTTPEKNVKMSGDVEKTEDDKILISGVVIPVKDILKAKLVIKF